MVRDPSPSLWDRVPGGWRLGALMAKVRRSFYRKRFSWPVYEMWRYSLNRRSKMLHSLEKQHLTLNALQRHVIKELEEQGIAIIHFNELFPDKEFSAIQQLAETLVQVPTNWNRIQDIKNNVRSEIKSEKFYLVRLLGESPTVDLKDKFMEFSLSDEVLRIVCGYLDMFSRLVSVSLWCNVPTNGPAVFSQRWHRDPDDRRLVKLFLYIRDVDETTGPFCYIPRTHNAGPLRKIYPQTINASHYPEDGAVEKIFGETQRLVCIGKAGTLIFCDTTGLHKGGHPTTRERLLFNAVYTTNAGAALIGKLYSISGSYSDALTPAAEYAIGHLQS